MHNKYKRYLGDDLLSKDKRLKRRWRWLRIASSFPDEEVAKWTHFQTSISMLDYWSLEVSQRFKYPGGGVEYEPSICYDGNIIISGEYLNTRIEAQIAAERLLINWITKEYKRVVK